MDDHELDFDGMEADEKDVCIYLAASGGQFASRMEIARRAGGKRRYEDDPKWAVRVLSRLIDKGIVELNSTGHYRLTPKQATAGAQPGAQEKSDQAKKVLVVDDNAGRHALVARFLQEAGWEVFTAGDLGDAMVQSADIPLDLVIQGLNLDAESRLKFMKFIRQYHPKAGIILYTGQPHYDDTVQAMLIDGTLQFVREGSIDDLRRAVQRAFQR